ncbi:hypothetical protein FB381_0015 [Nocardioides albertanoniae]|uniref:WXG100 family type VII secretion target n=1 Tax=Nocardioides albertanoniae TaxID=1175486 RepID=A0A543A0P9_9ACTN|nr:hypothetical protein [Nocardioides albertanoniae]TQL66167.1 hypothetical protein FB381_0015 [Nocardioides albertanoniae]
MADIDLNLDDLQTLWFDLSNICDQFGQVDGVGSDLIGAIGHHGLTDRVQDFGSSWDERREDMVEDLDTVWRGVKLVEQGFREMDKQLGQGLDGAVS